MLNITIHQPWIPPELPESLIDRAIDEAHAAKAEQGYLYIYKTTPYIDSIYVECSEESVWNEFERFIFHEDYLWGTEDEEYFLEHCVQNPNIRYNPGAFEDIYASYSEQHPMWHLKPYYTRRTQLLWHIYHSMKQNTPEELLFKAGLNELAVYLHTSDTYRPKSKESNLVDSYLEHSELSEDILKCRSNPKKPSDIYDGTPIRVLRALNSQSGAKLLSRVSSRIYVNCVNQLYPNLFTGKFNDAQCLYFQHLMDMRLTEGETGRLFLARREQLSWMWSKSRYQLFLNVELKDEQMQQVMSALIKIDPIYAQVKDLDQRLMEKELSLLNRWLLRERERNDILMRQSNRKRDDSLQERDHGYVVRFPQTTNDFCREAIYMHNCLIGYLTAVLMNNTTILFMRDPRDVNKPYITIEVYNGELFQAYRRFNEDCSAEEAEWILDYCKRHGIKTGRFTFHRADDLNAVLADNPNVDVVDDFDINDELPFF